MLATPRVDRMSRVLRAMVGCAGLLIWAEKLLLPTLKTDGIEMVRERSEKEWNGLDPRDLGFVWCLLLVEPLNTTIIQTD